MSQGHGQDPDSLPPVPSSSHGIRNSPSIFAYQTRLTRNPSTRSKDSLAAIVNHSPPASPIGGRLARSISRVSPEKNVGLGMGARPDSSLGHGRGSKSVDLVRGQWEAKINATSESPPGGSPVLASRSNRNSIFSPPLTSTQSPPRSVRDSVYTPPLASTASPPPAPPTPSVLKPEETGSSVMTSATDETSATDTSNGKYKSAYMAQRAAKRATVSGMAGFDPSKTPESGIASDRPSSRPSTRARPTSISSYSSLMSPNSTGDSAGLPPRKQSVEDTLAEARANALKRLERRKAESGAVSSQGAGVPVVKAVIETKGDVGLSSPFGSLFAPHPASTETTPSKPNKLSYSSTPTSRPSYRAIITPPSAAAVPSRFISSGLSSSSSSATPDSGPSTTSGGKYGSISRSDHRKLGRHLPRIASGDSGWGEDDDASPGHSRGPSGTGKRQSSLGRASGLSAVSVMDSPPAKEVEPRTPVTAPRSGIRVLSPSNSENRLPTTPSIPSTPSRKRTGYIPQTPKSLAGAMGVSASPRPEVAGEEMKGLMSALGAGVSRPRTGPLVDDGDGVTGLNRLRLSKLPLPASSAALAPAPLPSKRLVANTNWMDRQRHDLAAYEYLCHVGEAQQWIEGCLDENLEFGVTEMEEGLRDGVALAKLARVYEGEAIVRRIWTKRRTARGPSCVDAQETSAYVTQTFIFELTDLYDKKNIPKVIFCIHVLSHLLARLGKAERINNLLGQFDFSDEQLAATQKGLQGVAMPNFGEVGNALAKETNWEPEEEPETEDERRDRLLLECEPSIISLQTHLRSRLAQMKTSRIHASLELAEPIIARFQARSRGALCRRALKAGHDELAHLQGWAESLQAAARGHRARRRWMAKTAAVKSSGASIVGVQAQARGMLARVRKDTTQNHLDKSVRQVIALQAVCRGCLAREARQHHRKLLAQPDVAASIMTLQAVFRGQLRRKAAAKQQIVVQGHVATFTSLQSHLRGALVRRSRRAHEEKLDDATDIIMSIQAVCRGVLARRKKQRLVVNLVETSTGVTSFQALARARLAKKTHQGMQKALAKVEVAGSVGGLQAFLRSKLAKKSATEQKKKLEFVQPDVIGFQAVARGYLQRQEYREWRDYLVDPHTQGALVFLQSLIRGFLARRRLYQRTSYIHRNVDKIVKIQALYRGRIQRQMYDRLVTGEDVDVPTIQNYMHLLDDTEADFRDQIRIETLRTQVVDLINENKILETDVQELDTKIALILKNKMSFEDLARAKRTAGSAGRDQPFHAINSDPFTGAHLDRTSQRKLELYEHLFFTLQTKPEYLSRLLKVLSGENDEKERRLVESVTLTLYGFGHEKREEYLFHKLLQLAIHEEILRSKSLSDLADSRFILTGVAAQYMRPKLTPYLQKFLTEHVMRVVDAPDLDLCTDPVEIYNRLINAEESLTGVPSPLPRDLSADQVLQSDINARTQYIQHLQELRALTDFLIKGLVDSSSELPYTIRFLAREALLALRIRYPDIVDAELTPIVAKTVVLPFILPAIIAPETYSISPPVGAVERRNLATIANLITHVAAQDFSNSPKDRLVRVPLSEYIRSEGVPFSGWIIDVAEVEPSEAFFQTHELLESSLEAKPISITRTDIYGLLSILLKHSSAIVGNKADEMAKVLEELEGPPVDYDRSKATVSLRLTNRLAELQPGDPRALEKADWVQAKRHVLAVLRVQSGRTLFDVLVSRPEEIHEELWVEEVHRDIALEQARLAKHNLPPTPVEAEYHIESIRSLPFMEVKSRAIEFCMKLERSGKLARQDNFQGLLVSIASDIRQKHHLRKTRTKNLIAMNEAFEHTSEKKKGFEDQIKYYHDYIDSAMAALQQKGKKKPTFLSKQYRHQRVEAKSGRKSKFGSYKYTAADLYEKGILLSVNQFSPRQFDKVHVVLSSNEVGVFTLEMSHPNTASNPVIGNEQLRMEDLLQAQFDNNVRLDLFDGTAAFNLNMLIHQINKKFYAS
ncbi:Ras GTPase-activating-like protein IQGAP2/3, partial [Tremellales sp. Uapishka_1]